MVRGFVPSEVRAAMAHGARRNHTPTKRGAAERRSYKEVCMCSLLRRRIFGFEPQIELLEDRYVPSTLLQDNFNDNSLDPAKWRLVLPGIQGPPSVHEQNQRIELRNRGSLVTQQDFDPSEVGPITITGTWTFDLPVTAFQQEDAMSVFTRTDAGMDGPPYGSVQNGVGFNLFMRQDNPGGMGINYRIAPGEYVNLASCPIAIRNHDTFQFTIQDDGQTVSFSVHQIGGAGASAQLSASVPVHFASNHILFQNGQFSVVNKVSYLDDVTILGNGTDLVSTQLAWNPTQEGVDFSYQVNGADLPKDTTAALYWASGPTFDPASSVLAYSFPINNDSLKTMGDHGTFTVPASALGLVPITANDLVLVLDPPSEGHPTGVITESNETNNELAVAIPNVHLLGITTTDSRSVTISYEVTGVDLDRVPIRLFRSSDNLLGETADPEIALAQGTPPLSGTVGRHDNVILPLAEPLKINPGQKYVFAELDPDNNIPETYEADNSAFFKKWLIGAVTHGLALDGKFPSWIPTMIASLNRTGYDSTTFLNWASDSRLPVSGMTVYYGQRLAEKVRGKALELAGRRDFQPNDVIDLHLIGHSRGAIVISQAAQYLQSRGTPALDAGYLKLTMLDPHPGNNVLPLNLSITEIVNPLNVFGVSLSGQFSFNRALPLAWGAAIPVLVMQSQMKDPPPVVSDNVDESDVYFQHTYAFAARGDYGDPLERILNLWGRPVFGARLFSNRDLTEEVPGISHSGVVKWYQDNILGA